MVWSMPTAKSATGLPSNAISILSRLGFSCYVRAPDVAVDADDPVISALQLDLDAVFAVGWESVRKSRAAARPERQPVDPFSLRRLIRNAPRIHIGRERCGPQRRRGHPARDGEIAFQKQRGESQNISVVVEAIASVIRGEQRRVVGIQFARRTSRGRNSDTPSGSTDGASWDGRDWDERRQSDRERFPATLETRP